MWLSRYGLRKDNFFTDSKFIVWENKSRKQNPSCLMISDRDNTLIYDMGYVHKVSDLAIFNEAFFSLKKVNDAGGSIVIITNQGGIGLEKFTLKDFAKFNSLMIKKFRSKGIEIDFVIACPHHPNAKENNNKICDCRKPQTKMFEYIRAQYDVLDSKIAVFGDADSDIEAAERMRFAAYKVKDKGDLMKFTDLWLSKM